MNPLFLTLIIIAAILLIFAVLKKILKLILFAIFLAAIAFVVLWLL